MDKKTTLSDFIKSYLENLEIKHKKESYSDWVKSSGINSERIYKDALRDAETDYKRAGAEYGSLAERLSQNGLSASGYSDYINSSAYAEMQKRKSDALKGYSENEAKNLSGYQSYVSGIDKEISKETKDYLSLLTSLNKDGSDLYMETVSTVEKYGIIDYDTAYGMALKAGLSEEDARSAAELSTALTRRALKTKIIEAAIKDNMDGDEARAYAKSLGLNDEDADEIYEYVDSLDKGEYSSSVDVGNFK